jgi:hypothetical protein
VLTASDAASASAWVRAIREALAQASAAGTTLAAPTAN